MVDSAQSLSVPEISSKAGEQLRLAVVLCITPLACWLATDVIDIVVLRGVFDTSALDNYLRLCSHINTLGFMIVS